MGYRILAVLFACIFLFSCGGGGGSNTSTASQASQMAMISGKVMDNNGQPVANVTVLLGAQRAQSGTDGSFTLQTTTTTGSVIVLAKKDGYATNAKEVFVRASETSRMDLILNPEDIRTTISAASGGTVVASNNASVTFAPGSIQTSTGATYSGNVTVSVSYISPDTVNGANGFPAPYSGVDNGTQSLLQSVGVIEVKMTDAQGNALKLNPSMPATLQFPATSVAQGESTIPLWYYDETQKIWVREGQATRQPDGSYVGQVTHFTLWNCDIPVSVRNGTTKIKGCVVDATGNPITRGVIVQAEGAGWRDASDIDTAGSFTLPVPFATDVYVVYAVGGNVVVGPQKISPQLAEGEVRQLACQTITTTIDGNTAMKLPAFSNVNPLVWITTSNIQAYTGTYAGTYSGAETGTFNVLVTTNGNVTGTAHSITYNLNSAVTGLIGAGGALSLTASGQAGAATFSGSINATTGAISGTWSYAGSAGGGTFSGQKQ